ECADPALRFAHHRDPCGLQSVLRETHRRQFQGNALRLADAFHVAPHIPAFDRIDVEGRILPPLRAENGAEQKGPVADGNVRGARHLLHTHGSGVGVGAGKFVPEVDSFPSHLGTLERFPYLSPAADSRFPGLSGMHQRRGRWWRNSKNDYPFVLVECFRTATWRNQWQRQALKRWFW